MNKHVEKFSHVIITRFNVKTADSAWAQDRTDKPVLTDSWMCERFELFEAFYLPSMDKQTNHDFKCLIYFDKETAPQFKARFVELQKRYQFLNIRYVADDVGLAEQLDEDVRSLCSVDEDYVITSRIDNDDCYHLHAIERIQSEFKAVDCLGINFYKGYRYILGNEKILLKNRFFNGPFISLIENLKKDKLLTAMHGIHNTFYKRHKTKQINDGYYWLQTIHSSNLSNDISGIPTYNKKSLAEFAIDYSRINFSIKLYWRCFRAHFLNVKNYIPFKLKVLIKEKLMKE